MSDRNKTAADAPSGVGAQKRVDVEGVGGVLDATAEQASKPTGGQSYENAGTTVDVTGRGGILEDSNAEASKPSQGTESLPTAGRDSDDAGFNKDKTTDDSGPTKTFDNSNEPGSAVTQKAFPTATVKIAWGDERPFPHGDDALGESGGAKGGAQPADPVGKADDRVDLLKRVNVNNPQKGTDQWTGTDGNGVTKQQNPVTPKVDPNIEQRSSAFSHVIAAMKLADAEVAMGLLDEDKKYDRVAELEGLTPEELAAEERVVSRVKTAGLAKAPSTRREAATREGEVTGRIPSFQKKAGEIEAPAPQPINDALGDSALFIR